MMLTTSRPTLESSKGIVLGRGLPAVNDAIALVVAAGEPLPQIPGLVGIEIVR